MALNIPTCIDGLATALYQGEELNAAREDRV